MTAISSIGNSSLQFHMESIRDISGVGKLWSALEQESDSSFFTSWYWMESWLQVMGPDASICKVYCAQRLVGLGLFVLANERRHKFLCVTQIRLQSTGDEHQDQVWPEYNGMLVAKGFEVEVYQGLMEFLVEKGGDWDELVIGPLDDSLLTPLSAGNSFHLVDLWNAPSFGVDLVGIRSAGQSYLDSLSKNTRYQIRKAIRQCGDDLSLQSAKSEEEAQQYLCAIATLHKQRWLQDSGFNNDVFVNFHKALIRQCFDKGVIEIVKLQVKGVDVGYLYNFLFKNRVYFYLSGIDLVMASKMKPGLVLHALCIQKHLERGAESYDFLGGYARYKENLGKETGRLAVAAFQKPLLKLRVEQAARRIKHYIEDNVANDASSNETCR